MRIISWQAEDLLGYEEVLYSIELDSKLVT
jgi:hypothetical protein